MKPISVQLYSLRQEAEKDFVGVLERLSAIGFKGVEPAGFWNLTPAEFKKIVTDLGMEVSSSHSPWTNPENINEVIEVAGILGIDRVACGYGPDNFKTIDAIKQTADTVNSMIEPLKKAGITLFQHNHYWEFEEIDGRVAYDIYLDYCPEIKFELDIYWACNFGKFTAEQEVSKYKDRTILMHVKDGPLVKDKAHTAAGTGKVNIPAAVAAADQDVLKWLVVELDACDTDMFTAVEKSFKYLVENKIGYGK